MLLLTDFDYDQNWLYSWIMYIFIIYQIIKIHISFINLSFFFIEFMIYKNKLYFLKLFWRQQNLKSIYNSFIMLFAVNLMRKSHFFQSSCRYEQYICRYYFIIVFVFSIWSSVLKWNAVENHVSISSHVHNVFQKIAINWFS